jgi:hypothetical protein
MGHAFENALIDTVVRYQRMAGRNTLWLPGTDHASIAVSAILDRQFKAEGLKTREEVGRDRYWSGPGNGKLNPAAPSSTSCGNSGYPWTGAGALHHGRRAVPRSADRLYQTL